MSSDLERQSRRSGIRRSYDDHRDRLPILLRVPQEGGAAQPPLHPDARPAGVRTEDRIRDGLSGRGPGPGPHEGLQVQSQGVDKVRALRSAQVSLGLRCPAYLRTDSKNLSNVFGDIIM